MKLASGGSARLISETLDTVVAPPVRDALISTALEQAGVREVPSDIDQFRGFVEGPLREAMVQGLGPELADSVVEELERMAQLTDPASSKPLRRSSSRGSGQRSLSPPPRRNTPTHRRTSSNPPKPPARGTLPSGMDPARMPEPVDPSALTLPPPSPHDRRVDVARVGLTPPPFSAPSSGMQSKPKSGWGSDEYPAGAADTLGFAGASPESATLAKDRPYVLVATTDLTLPGRLTPWLDEAAEVVVVSSVRELVKDLDALDEARIAILIDCRRPSLRPTAVAALADELPPNVRVVLWGASVEQERGVLAVSPNASRWIVLQADVRPKEIAKRCADLVG